MEVGTREVPAAAVDMDDTLGKGMLAGHKLPWATAVESHTASLKVAESTRSPAQSLPDHEVAPPLHTWAALGVLIGEARMLLVRSHEAADV